MGETLKSLFFLRWGAVLFLFLGIFVYVYALIAAEDSVAHRYWNRYCVYLERKLRLMFIFTPGVHVVYGQLFAIAFGIAFGLTIGLPYSYTAAIVAVAALGPAFYIEKMRTQRVEAIEEQINPFLMGLANALKSTPSIGDAFASVQYLLPNPLKQEIELAAKEMRVGSSLDQALLSMANRVNSPILDSALSAILIGRQVGGNLPLVLETTASTLREMARLEGVVRTKTAEGKFQLWVLAGLPAGVMYVLNLIQPGYFIPLESSFFGYVVCTIAGVFWMGSLFMARKILTVDI